MAGQVSSSPDAKAETEAAASLFDTLDSTTPRRIPTGVADAKKPITVQNFRMLACSPSRQYYDLWKKNAYI